MRTRLSESCFFILTALLVLVHGPLRAQAGADLARFRQKFPENLLVHELEQKDLDIRIRKDKSFIIVKDHSSRVILRDNATSLSDYKYYFNKTLRPTDIHAYSLVPDGDRYIKIPVREFVKTAEIEDGNYYDDITAYNFNFNSVGKGTKLIVETETEINDPHSSIAFWFGRYSPVEKARLTLRFPADVKILYHMFGGPDTALIKFTTERKGKMNIFTWEANDLKGYQEDKPAPNDRYFSPHIILQVAGYDLDGKFVPVIGTVGDLYRYFYKNLRDSVSHVKGSVKDLGDSLTSGLTLPEEKAGAIYQWVQNQIRYVAIEDGDNGVVPCNPELVLQRRYGDCKGKTSLLVNMLRSQDLKASYAWIGTRELPYLISEFPSRASCNHMVAVWWNEKGAPVILDGTSQFHTMDETPAFIQGKECLIEKGACDYLVYTIPVAPPQSNTCTDSVRISIKGGTLAGTGFAKFTGERKSRLLQSFNRIDTCRYKEIVSLELPKASNKFIVGRTNPSALTETGKPFTIGYSFTIPDYVTEGNDKIYINMNLDRFLENLSLEEDRTMPVESEQTFNNIFSCTLKIPGAFFPEKIPVDASLTTPDFGFTQHYELVGDVLTLTTRVYIGFQVIGGPKMKQLSQMLTVLHRAYSKSIVLIKK